MQVPSLNQGGDMNRPHGNRARLGRVLLAAAAALAILALPGLAASHDRNHEPPGDAGTIQSFDAATGVLAIDLANGGSVSGLVVRRTHIRCGDEGRHHGRHRGRGKGEASASRRGGPEDERSGRDNEAGEDPPGHDGTPPGSSEGPGQGAEHSDRCNVDDLVPGATVKVAELVLLDGNAFYKLVALPKQEPPTDD
jgi:hypothetical protein